MIQQKANRSGSASCRSPPESGPDLAEGDAGRRGRPDACEHGVSGSGPCSHDDGSHLVGSEPAGQGAFGLGLAGGQLQPAPDGAEALGRLAEGIKPTSWLVRRPRGQQSPDGVPLRRCIGEHGQLGPSAQPFGQVHHLEAEAEVGLVGPVTGHGVGVGKPGVGGRRPFLRQLGHEPAEQRLYLAEHVLLGGERHLQVDLVELTRAPVGPRRLVPEARRDLEVAVDPPDHQELLELLRGLRESVELARVQPAGDEVVARRLRARKR